MNLSLVAFLTIVVIVSGQTTEQCTRLGNAYNSICPRHTGSSLAVPGQGKPGKRGPAGIKGERGEIGGIGAKGSSGEADYDRVEELISERLQEVTRNQTKTFGDLTAELDRAKEKIEQLENRTHFCAFTYRGKCFWFEMYDGIRCERAPEICAARGGKPANIYSKYHYYMLLGYLRMFAEAYRVTHAWLGVKYNLNTKVVSLSDGSTATFVKWHPGYPLQHHTSCVYLQARLDPSSTGQNLVNAHREWAPHGVVCEI